MQPVWTRMNSRHQFHQTLICPLLHSPCYYRTNCKNDSVAVTYNPTHWKQISAAQSFACLICFQWVGLYVTPTESFLQLSTVLASVWWNWCLRYLTKLLPMALGICTKGCGNEITLLPEQTSPNKGQNKNE